MPSQMHNIIAAGNFFLSVSLFIPFSPLNWFDLDNRRCASILIFP